MPKRKQRRNPRPPGEDAKTRLRAEAALELRAAGQTYREIGARLGVSEKTAYYDVQDELGRLDPVIKEKAERLRELEGRRCDRLTAALEPAIASGDARAVIAAVRVMERRARLYGLDAPTTISTPAGDAIPVRIVMQQEKG